MLHNGCGQQPELLEGFWAPGTELSTEPWSGAAIYLVLPTSCKPAREVAVRWHQATVLVSSPGLSVYTLGQLSGSQWKCSSLPTLLLRSMKSLCSLIIGLFPAWPSRCSC